MGLMRGGREPQLKPRTAREPLTDLDAKPPLPPEPQSEPRPQRKRLADTGAEAGVPQPEQPAKPKYRRSLALSQTSSEAPQGQSPSQPEPRRPRMAAGPATPERQQPMPSVGRSRGAIAAPGDTVPGLQNIMDPPRATADAPPAAPSREQQPTRRAARSRGAIAPPCDQVPGLHNVIDPPRATRETPDIGPSKAEPSTPRAGRSRRTIALPGNDTPGLQNIVDPPGATAQTPEAVQGDEATLPPAPVRPAKVGPLAGGLRAKQNFPLALAGGLTVAVVGAMLWALITVMTNYQVGWMAVGVGFFVGGMVRMLGRGVDRSFGYLGAALSLVGCLLGNLLSLCAVIAGQEGVSLLAVLTHIGSNPIMIPAALLATFHSLDLLFYGIAVYEGYRFSFRQTADAETSSGT
jgi:hypothetical protein